MYLKRAKHKPSEPHIFPVSYMFAKVIRVNGIYLASLSISNALFGNVMYNEYQLHTGGEMADNQFLLFSVGGAEIEQECNLDDIKSNL